MNAARRPKDGPAQRLAACAIVFGAALPFFTVLGEVGTLLLLALVGVAVAAFARGRQQSAGAAIGLIAGMSAALGLALHSPAAPINHIVFVGITAVATALLGSLGAACVAPMQKDVRPRRGSLLIDAIPSTPLPRPAENRGGEPDDLGLARIAHDLCDWRESGASDWMTLDRFVGASLSRNLDATRVRCYRVSGDKQRMWNLAAARQAPTALAAGVPTRGILQRVLRQERPHVTWPVRRPIGNEPVNPNKQSPTRGSAWIIPIAQDGRIFGLLTLRRRTHSGRARDASVHARETRTARTIGVLLGALIAAENRNRDVFPNRDRMGVVASSDRSIGAPEPAAVSRAELSTPRALRLGAAALVSKTERDRRAAPIRHSRAVAGTIAPLRSRLGSDSGGRS